jgi:sulfopyruvate decarboxylase subunit alpha
MVASSAYVSAPNSAMKQPATQVASRSGADGSSLAMSPVVRKMPDPMMPPTTSRMAETGPMARSSGLLPLESAAVMSVSYENSKIVYQGIKDAGIQSLSALPETWLGLLLQQAEPDPEMRLIQVAKEEEAIGIAAGAYFAGERHILLMQNHGFLAAINGIVSLAQLYTIPLCMLIALRGHWGEPYPWHTRGGIVTEPVLRALNIPFEYARNPQDVGRQIREAYTLSQSSLSPVALLLTRDLMEEAL